MHRKRESNTLMCYKVVVKRTVYVDADSPDEAEQLALEGDDLFGVEEEVLLVKFSGNSSYYSCCKS